jgi:hypothetical protein
VRSFVGALLTTAGVVAVLGLFGSVAKTVEVWRSPETTCVYEGRPGFDAFCARDVPVTGLAKVPWTYLGLSLALVLLAIALFTLRERIRPEDVPPAT